MIPGKTRTFLDQVIYPTSINHGKSLENHWKIVGDHGFFHGKTMDFSMKTLGSLPFFHSTARHAPGRGASWRPPSHRCESRVFLEFHPRWTQIV